MKYSRLIGCSAAFFASLYVAACANRATPGDEVQPGYVEPEQEIAQPRPQVEVVVESPPVVEAREMTVVDDSEIAVPVEAAVEAEDETEVATPKLPAKADRSDIIWIQERLKELGYYEGSIDGSVGGATRRAIEVYQGDQGITVDGRPSAELREYMWRNGG